MHSFAESPNYTRPAKCGFFDFFSSKPSTSDLQKEIDDLREKVEKLEEQQRELLTTINSAKADFASYNDTQKKKIEGMNEIQQIMNHYGNNPDGMSALHYAIKKGDLYAVNLLIANGADVNSTEMVFRPQTTFTALTRAVVCNQLEIAKLLIALGADVNLSPYKDCCYPIYYAAESSSGDLVMLLIENGSILDKIHPQHNEQNAQTPLHYACKSGNYEAVVALVNGGAKIDGNAPPQNIGVNHWNEGTPLDWAACNLTYKDNPQNLELIKFLVNNGARRRFQRYNGEGNHNYLPCSVINGYLISVGR